MVFTIRYFSAGLVTVTRIFEKKVQNAKSQNERKDNMACFYASIFHF